MAISICSSSSLDRARTSGARPATAASDVLALDVRIGDAIATAGGSTGGCYQHSQPMNSQSVSKGGNATLTAVSRGSLGGGSSPGPRKKTPEPPLQRYHPPLPTPSMKRTPHLWFGHGTGGATCGFRETVAHELLLELLKAQSRRQQPFKRRKCRQRHTSQSTSCRPRVVHAIDAAR